VRVDLFQPKGIIVQSFLFSVFGLCFSGFFVWRVEQSAQWEAWSSSGYIWWKCIVEDISGCPETPSVSPGAWVWFGLHFFLSFQGVLLFLTWGTQEETLELWRDLFTGYASRGHTPHGESSKQDKGGHSVTRASSKKEHGDLELEHHHSPEFSSSSDSPISHSIPPTPNLQPQQQQPVGDQASNTTQPKEHSSLTDQPEKENEKAQEELELTVY